MRTIILDLCAAGAVAAGWLFRPVLVLLLVVLPFLSCMLCALNHRRSAIILSVMLFICAAGRMPLWFAPSALTLCALCALNAVSAREAGRDMGRTAFRITLLSLLSFALVLYTEFPSIDISDVLAGLMVSWLEQRPECNRLLVALAQRDLITGDFMNGTSFLLGQNVLILPGVRREMLLSLRGELMNLTRIVFCAFCGAWPVLTEIITGFATDKAGRGAKAWSLPAFRRWQLGRRERQLLCVAVLACCLPHYTSDTELGLFMLICRYAVMALCCMLGTSVLCGVIAQKKKSLFVLSCMLGAMISALIPSAMPLLVILDMSFDFRHLRTAAQPGQ